MGQSKNIQVKLLFTPETFFILQEIGHKTDVKNKSGRMTVTKVIEKAIEEFINKFEYEPAIS